MSVLATTWPSGSGAWSAGNWRCAGPAHGPPINWGQPGCKTLSYISTTSSAMIFSRLMARIWSRMARVFRSGGWDICPRSSPRKRCRPLVLSVDEALGARPGRGMWNCCSSHQTRVLQGEDIGVAPAGQYSRVALSGIPALRQQLDWFPRLHGRKLPTLHPSDMEGTAQWIDIAVLPKRLWATPLRCLMEKIAGDSEFMTDALGRIPGHTTFTQLTWISCKCKTAVIGQVAVSLRRSNHLQPR
jgi:hypothetical protein